MDTSKEELTKQSEMMAWLYLRSDPFSICLQLAVGAALGEGD
jgi:hypothetical protein